jgi:hypothetical protein
MARANSVRIAVTVQPRGVCVRNVEQSLFVLRIGQGQVVAVDRVL